MMTSKLFCKLLCAVSGLVLLSATALALPPMGQVFTTHYKVGAKSALKKADCGVCHIGRQPKLNPYGEDLKAALNGAKELTADALKQVESKDSDKDGFKNLDEIKADTNPGDLKSKPGKTGKARKK
ncbi:MAG: hypothetical protein RMJ43_02195 [Chloroherpetonaceae bacterium]|nr:hypothetical protein [Chthonomonadaceae bacterium]MDW8206619.1 hypothetical protein [Chloroherpetonaceae bacterium]